MHKPSQTQSRKLKQADLQHLERQFQLKREAIDEDARTAEVAFSSEEPYDRGFGIEILDHSPGAINLSRLNNGGAVLVGHNTNDHVGVVEVARADSDRKGRAVLRFGRGARASEIFQDVVDGIRVLVSVAYRWDKYEVTEGKNGTADEYRVTEWTPYEISLVAIPADPTVGVGRSEQLTDEFTQSQEIPVMDPKKKSDDDKTTQAAAVAAAPAVDLKKERESWQKAEQQRYRDIMTEADAHNARDIGLEHFEKGSTLAQFQTALLEHIGKRNNEVRSKHDPNMDDALGLSRREVEKFSFLRIMNALANPQDPSAQQAAGYEREVSSAAAAKLGLEARGFFIPTDVLGRTLSAGTATDGAELVSDDLLSGSFIEALRNRLVVMAAGATVLTGLVGNVDVPRQTSQTAAGWISTEDGDAGASEPQFDQVSLTPKDLAAYTEVTRRLRMQSSLSIENLVRNDLIYAAAKAIDAGALYGTGLTGQPKGVAEQTGINTFNFAAADPVYAETVRMIKECMLDNADMGRLAYIIDPEGWEAGMTKEKASGTAKFIISENNTINGYPYHMTNQVTAEDWFFGNWADLLIGMWGGLELNVDPYTHSLKGKTRYVMFQTVDTAVRHPESFCHCNDGA